MSSTFTPLRRRGFRGLLSAYAIGQFGAWFGEIAITVLVFERTGSVLASAGVFLALEIPPAVFGPAVVAKLEQRGSGVAVPLLFLVGAIIYAALGAGADQAWIAVVLLFIAIDGVVILCGRSLVQAAVANMFQGAELRDANALINLIFTIGFAVGPFLAGVVLAAWSVETALYLDAAAYAIAALIMALPSIPSVRGEPSHWAHRLREAVGYVRDRPVLGKALVASTVITVFTTWPTPIEVAYITDTLRLGPEEYGIFIAAWGVGTFVGGIMFAVARNLHLLVPLVASFVCIGTSFVLMAIAPSFTWALIASVIGGVGNGMSWVATRTAVQQLVAAAFQARVVSLLESLTSIAPGIGFIAGAGVAVVFSTRLSLFVAGIGVILSLIGSAWLLRGTGTRKAFDKAVLEVEISEGRIDEPEGVATQRV